MQKVCHSKKFLRKNFSEVTFTPQIQVSFLILKFSKKTETSLKKFPNSSFETDKMTDFAKKFPHLAIFLWQKVQKFAKMETRWFWSRSDS